MRPVLALAAFTVVLLASAPSAGAGAGRPRVALSVSPAHLAIATPGSKRIKVRNDGADRVVVDVARRSVGLRGAGAWLQIAPAHVSLGSGASAILTLRAAPPRLAEPGDHNVLVLLTTRPVVGDRVDVQVRLGVRVRMVVPGRVVRQVTLGSLRVNRRRAARFVSISIANHGNVTVQLRGHVTALLVRRGRPLVRLGPRVPRALRPGARAVLKLRYSGPARGLVTAIVQVRLGSRMHMVERRYRFRL